MLDPFSYWTRMLSAWRTVDTTSRKLGETAEASGKVVASRIETMRHAAQSPWSGDYAELSRMMPEKVAAFSLAGNVVMRASLEAQAAWWQQVQSLAAVMMRGRLPSTTEVAEIWSRASLDSLRAFELASRTGRDVLAPVHKAATANARRLR